MVLEQVFVVDSLLRFSVRFSAQIIHFDFLPRFSAWFSGFSPWFSAPTCWLMFQPNFCLGLMLGKIWKSCRTSEIMASTKSVKAYPRGARTTNEWTCFSMLQFLRVLWRRRQWVWHAHVIWRCCQHFLGFYESIQIASELVWMRFRSLLHEMLMWRSICLRCAELPSDCAWLKRRSCFLEFGWRFVLPYSTLRGRWSMFHGCQQIYGSNEKLHGVSRVVSSAMHWGARGRFYMKNSNVWWGMSDLAHIYLFATHFPMARPSFLSCRGRKHEETCGLFLAT